MSASPKGSKPSGAEIHQQAQSIEVIKIALKVIIDRPNLAEQISHLAEKLTAAIDEMQNRLKNSNLSQSEINKMKTTLSHVASIIMNFQLPGGIPLFDTHISSQLYYIAEGQPIPPEHKPNKKE